MGSISLLDQIQVKPQQQISTAGGEVWHALKSTEDSFIGFGEAYFSWVEPGAVKAWKQHLHMTMNLVLCSETLLFDCIAGVIAKDEGETLDRLLATDVGYAWRTLFTDNT
mgnify:CR=1 FL=1